MSHAFRPPGLGLAVAAVALVASASAFAFAADPGATPAPSKPATDSWFGVSITDPYRNLENKAHPAVAAWMKAESARASAVLARIPGRDAMLKSLERYDGAVTARVAEVVRLPGDRWVFERRSAKANQFALFARDGLAGRDRLLVDPEAIEKATGKPRAINWFQPSGDGAIVAYGISQQGSEDAALHLVNARDGRELGQPISRADYAGVSFSPDGKRYVFTRLQEMKRGMPDAEKYLDAQVWLLGVGEPVAKAVKVFGNALPELGLGRVESPAVSLTADGRWAIGTVLNGVQREQAIFVSPQAGLLAGKPQWRRIVSAADAVTGATYRDDTLYLVSHQNAPRSKVLALDLKQPEMASARLVVEPSERVIVAASAASDGIYVEARDGNVKRLLRLPYGGGSATEVKLPIEGSFNLTGDESSLTATDPRLPGAVIRLESWTRAARIYAVGADGQVADTGLQPAGPYDAPADLVATEVKVKAADGAMVPMSIIHKRGLALDGNNPTLLYGYASYGITEEPAFSSGRLAWLDAGGVFAVANPRGSSVYGEDWYRGGYKDTKPNTWNDFIACAEYLIAQKYTRPAKLGIWGGSAGGILVGRAMTTRPDLFAAVVPQVGALDMVRSEFTANGPSNIPEFGSVATEPGFRGLLAMSSYEHVVPGTPYPAVLLPHGINDPRVEVWNSTKFAARLAAATTSGKPVLLRLDYDAGHGVGSTKKQRLEEQADVFAFLLWQMGVAGYQP